MLLTRKACYGLIAVRHLAVHEGESSFSARDLADIYGFPQEALAKILQRLARAGLLVSHQGTKGGYTLAGNRTKISVLDVIKASEGEPHDATHGKHWRRHLQTLPGCPDLRMVSEVVEDALRRISIDQIRARDGQGRAPQ